MMNCKEATRLMSDGQDRALTPGERVALKLHTMMCRGCTNYGKHMVFLRKAVTRLREGRREADT